MENVYLNRLQQLKINNFISGKLVPCSYVNNYGERMTMGKQPGDNQTPILHQKS